MKELLLVLCCLSLYQVLKAQTFSEWFRQNHTQLLYLQEQIAALQVYNATQQNGYTASNAGLGAIDSTEQEDEDEHAAYFTHLQTPSYGVLADPRVGEIQILCERASFIANAIEALGPLRNPATADWPGLGEDAAAAIEKSVESIDGRLNVLLFGKTEMSDAQRLRVIQQLDLDTKALYERAVYQFELFSKQPILP
jgi:hypothetical protein